MADRHKAIRATHNSVVTINGENEAWDEDGNIVVLDEAKIEAEMTRLQAEWVNAKPMNDWKASMQETDSSMPRYAEDILDGMADKSGVAQITLDRLQAKKDLREAKP